MTREETKKRFQSWCQGYIGNNASDEDYQMFNNIMALLEQEPKSEWQHDHEILKAYSDGANEVLDKIRAEIMQLDYDTDYVDYDYNDMVQTETIHTICREEVIQIIDKYKTGEE
jgi:hypothetical protein